MSRNEMLEGFILGQRLKGHAGRGALLPTGSGGGLPSDYIRGFAMGLGSVGWRFYPDFEPEDPSPCVTFSSPAEFYITKATGYQTKTWDGTLQYSTDGLYWTDWDGTGELHSSSGTLRLRGRGNSVISGSVYGHGWLIFGSSVSCTGNLETLLDYRAVQAQEHPVPGEYAFRELFRGNTALITAPELPSGTLSPRCFYRMYYGCTQLLSAPDIAAAVLPAGSCYQMFYNCGSLTGAPALLATGFGEDCCFEMFCNCSSLALPPAIGAVSVGRYACNGMFRNCSGLGSLPALGASTLGDYCYANMFAGTGTRLRAAQNDYCIYPFSFSGSGGSGVANNMFDGTTVSGEIRTPARGTVYYATLPTSSAT